MINVKGYNLRNFRKNKNLTIQEFANEIGIEVTKYISFEEGLKRVDEDTLSKIYSTFNVNEDELMKES
ncbi:MULTISPECIES: helix-turn-helix domain-containing protein [Metabacillus]|uniref:helix-turn-helix domain-containing protein n=1 Tax=Metabacillus TaxID=2675233 RepID=UPI000C7FFC75|nr:MULTISPECIES: helix-turn-helix transcriptional regulator [Metabacillus]MCM3443979.1 helix-turn-helix domain-containing protein [Metabacillus halosaccharovorans]PMC34966.1 hypothetical protein CJ195_20890 [Bacillus sp. UMB0899]